MQTTYTLADLDGALHVCCEQPDYNEPNLIANYWPTGLRTRDLLSFYDCTDAAQLAEFKINHGLPGEFYVLHPAKTWQRGTTINLTEGGRTQSVKTEINPAPRPKSRLPLEWHGGHWHKKTAAGWKRID